jgi:hypothetical protein
MLNICHTRKAFGLDVNEKNLSKLCIDSEGWCLPVPTFRTKLQSSSSRYSLIYSHKITNDQEKFMSVINIGLSYETWRDIYLGGTVKE